MNRATQKSMRNQKAQTQGISLTSAGKPGILRRLVVRTERSKENDYLTQVVGIFGSFALLSGCASTEISRQASRTDSEIAPAPEVAHANPAASAAMKVAPNSGKEATADWHFSMAQAYSAEGQVDRAIEEYQLTLAHDPESALVHTRLAMEYVKKGMLSAALETVQEALRKDPKFVDARLMLAGLYSTLRDLDSAIVEYDRVLKQDPKNEEALVYRAQISVEAGRNEEAIRLLKGFLKKQPDSAVSWYYLGRVYQKLDQKDEAIRSYRKAADLRPGFAQAGLALGWTLEDSNRAAEALVAYQRLYDEAQDTTAANRIATLLLKQEKYREALPYLEVVEAADADDMNVRVKLGLVYMELKKLDRAETLFKSILAKTPDADRVRYYLASVYEEQKRLDESVAEVMKIQPGSKLHGDAVVHAGWLLKQAGRAPEALELVRSAVKTNPGHATFYLFMASIEEDAKRYEAASQVLKAGVKVFPEDEKMHFYLGSLLDRQGDVDGCLQEMERVLKLNPDHVDALNYLGYTWTVRGTRLNDAERLIRRALALKPDNGFVQDSWGWHLFLRGRVRESIVELEKAAKLKPNESTILEHLADAYLRYNLREKAVIRYQEAARVAQDEGSRRKIESKLDLLRIEVAERGAGTLTPAVVADSPRSMSDQSMDDSGGRSPASVASELDAKSSDAADESGK